jgi:FtsP/CotA-like multicopper oxidase with cupredoxin domain
MTIPVTHFLLPTASRVEVIVSAPPSSVRLAQLIRLAVDTGPDGDYDPQRPLATIQPVNVLSASASRLAAAATAPKVNARRFAGLASAQIAARRTVFFDEINATDTFLMVVEGKPAHVLDPNAAPDIVATQGTVEEWIVQNRTQEVHEFHFHQLHFLVKSQDNFELNGSARADVATG